MRLPGLFPNRSKLTAASFGLAAALALSACVEVAGTAAAPDQPAISTDETIYAARSDGQYTVPALPVAEIPEAYRRQVVEYSNEQAPGTIIIDPSTRMLYYILDAKKALRYGIAVGAEGFGWSGESIVANKRNWPTWTPPREMIERKPELEKWKNGQPGGLTNPLGARAIYLTSGGVDYGYRIHGTPEWKTIGRNASSGCFRMINQDVMDLYERVKGGEKVIVLTASGEMPKGLSIPKQAAPKKKAAPAVVEAAAVAAPPLAVLTPPTIAGGPGTGIAAPGLTPPVVAPAVAPAAPSTPAPVEPAAAEPAPTADTPPAATAPTCSVALVNGVCPQG